MIAAYFLWNTRGGWTARFTQDDIMNLYGAWTEPWGRLVDGAVLFFTPIVRPVGGLFYKAIDSFAGLNPTPYRFAAMLLLAVNVWLLYAVARRVADRRESGLLAALFGAFHVRMADLYFSTGSAYDVLAYLFVMAAMLVHLRGGPMWAVCGVFALALGSKEVAVGLPVVLFAYELLWNRRKTVRDWLWERGAAPFATGAMAVLFVLGRAGKSHLANNPAYTPTFTAERFFETWGTYLDRLVLREQWMGAWAVAAVLGALLAVGLAKRSKAMVFGWLWLVAFTLPLNFIPPRGLFAMYLPLAGLCLWLGVLLAPVWRALPAIAVALTLAWEPQRAAMLWWTEEPSRRIHAMTEDLREVRLPAKASVLLIDDPFETDEWTPLFLVRMSQRDAEIGVFRTKMNPELKDRMADFSFLYRFESGRMRLVRGASQ
ncbi:MAG: glycosyltransferase family 39 protein [Bryobacteraceae bacterium]|nr:glycosyltransferase family 39 protein [Bryobacteraceae bacterium]